MRSNLPIPVVDPGSFRAASAARAAQDFGEGTVEAVTAAIEDRL
ncbi:MAG: hypothetical protein ABEH56_04870 [Salinirussus sp.]